MTESLLTRWARTDFQKAVRDLRFDSYFVAMRYAASETLGVPIGRVVPITDDATRERIQRAAQRTCRPLVEVVRILDGAEFLLLVDTKKK